MNKLFLSGLALGLCGMSVAQAQFALDVSGGNAPLHGRGNSNAVSNTAGMLGPDVEIEGVAIINNEVFIDGVRVPPEKTTYVGKKSGKTYHIRWGKGGNIAVEEK